MIGMLGTVAATIYDDREQAAMVSSQKSVPCPLTARMKIPIARIAVNGRST